MQKQHVMMEMRSVEMVVVLLVKLKVDGFALVRVIRSLVLCCNWNEGRCIKNEETVTPEESGVALPIVIGVIAAACIYFLLLLIFFSQTSVLVFGVIVIGLFVYKKRNKRNSSDDNMLHRLKVLQADHRSSVEE
jgi:hypothetical protein